MQCDITIKMNKLGSHVLIFINLYNIIVTEKNSWSMTLDCDLCSLKIYKLFTDICLICIIPNSE